MFRKISHLFTIFVLLMLMASCATQKKTATRSRPSTSKLSRPSPPTPAEPSRATRRVNRVDSQQQQIIQTARSFTGTPYRWGGTTRSGMDCSGLLMTSFQQAGINLPRTSAEQSKVGRLVSIHELRPGDLVFFATKSKHSKKVTHAGLVTEIRGKKKCTVYPCFNQTWSSGKQYIF
ncbi:MAG: C40 family peptidase [Cyclobacteriaceae bacterium]